MRGIKLKSMLLIVLICILMGMVMALSSPGVISAGLSALAYGQNTTAASDEPATTAQASAKPAGTLEASALRSIANEAIQTPDPDAQYYSVVETRYTSPKKDQWTYQSPVLYVDVRKFSEKAPVRRVYFIAEIRTKDPALLFPSYAGNDTNDKVRMLPAKIAEKNKAVLAVASDCAVNRYHKGIIIRNGSQISDKMMADTLALLPDGTFRIYTPKEITPATLISLGVKNTFSCGPTLIRDGVVAANLAKIKQTSRSARTGVGMIEPGHYIFIVVDGCDRNYSMGATLMEFTAMFQKLGCKQAYNLDGGQSAVMCFMGEQLSGKPGSTPRKVSDLLAVGKSELVGVK